MSIGLDRYRDESVYVVTDANGVSFRGRTLVLGPGRTPHVPDCFNQLDDNRVVHLTSYLPTVESWHGEPPDDVVIAGGSQSAVEIALDLSTRFPKSRVHVVARSWSLRAKDHSPFSEEIYFPTFTKQYHAASAAERRRLDLYTRPTNYSAADKDVLDRLYVEMYEQNLMGAPRIFVRGDSLITSVQSEPDGLLLTVEQVISGGCVQQKADLVVLATGFRDMGKGETQEPHHPLLNEVASAFQWTAEGYLDVAEDYALIPSSQPTPPLFLNGLCESTHGIGDAGSFSLLSVRAGAICGSLERYLRKRLTSVPDTEVNTLLGARAC